MTSSSLSMSCKSFGEALSRSSVKSSHEKEGRLLLALTANSDQGRANPVSTDLSTDFFSIIPKKNKNYPTATLKLF